MVRGTLEGLMHLKDESMGLGQAEGLRWLKDDAGGYLIFYEGFKAA